MAQGLKVIRQLYLNRGGACEECGKQLNFDSSNVPGYPKAELARLAGGGLCLVCPTCRPDLTRILRAARRATANGYGTMPKKITVLYETANGRCVYCGTKTHRSNRSAGPKSATIEHLQPVSRGGTNEPENLALACRRCNTVKGNLTPLEFLRALLAVCMFIPPEMISRMKP